MAKCMIAIHDRPGSFSDQWIAFCVANNIPFKRVNAHDSAIISQLSDCSGFMWHWHHNDSASQLFARQLTLSVEKMGIKVFPNANTAWHFDDKVGQKYLYESLKLPLVPSYVFYEKSKALEWVGTAEYPLVFKLRGGAGAQNVILVKDRPQAKRLVYRAFSRRGFPAFSLEAYTQQTIWEFRRDRTFKQLLRIPYWAIRTLAGLKPRKARMLPSQNGYVYFQQFVPNNDFDDRIVVIGDRCFCVRRYCRPNDFRASGSGVLHHDHTIFPTKTIETAFRVAKSLNSQSIALDFIYDREGAPLFVESSYCYAAGKAYEECDGYFDSNLKWHDIPVRPQQFIIEDFLGQIASHPLDATAFSSD